MDIEYGTWAQLEWADGKPGWRTVWDHVDEACGHLMTAKQYETIVMRYVGEINDQLPDGVYLSDDTFYGPYPWVSVDLDRIAGDVDLLEIIQTVEAEDAN